MKLEKKALIFLSNKRKNLGLVKINKLDQLLFINKKKKGGYVAILLKGIKVSEVMYKPTDFIKQR